ncbi:MAG: hypothetical protein QXP34_00060 [Candidatus Aenigmatarchaeota archaeon]
MEKKKIIIMTMIIGVMLGFGIIYSGVLNYYGKIVGNVNVEGPIFYANLTGNNQLIGSLLLNTKPISNYTTQFNDSLSVVFWSDNLGGIDFNYIPKCEFYLKIYSSSSSNVKLICEYYNISGSKNPICEKDVEISAGWNFISNYCFGSSNLNSVKHIVYKIEGLAIPEVAFYIETNTNGDTRLQITKAP